MNQRPPILTIYRCSACHDLHNLTHRAPAGTWVLCPSTGVLVQIHQPVAVAA